MLGLIMTGIKSVGSFLKSSQTAPISLNDDDEIQMVKQPLGPVDIIFKFINRMIRPGLLIIVMWMFYWFASEPALAKLWIAIVKDIPDRMWDAIMVILLSVGMSKVIRDFKTPSPGSQMVIRGPTVADDADGDGIPDGAAKPPVEEITTVTKTTTMTENPTLAAWKAKQGKPE